MAALAQEITAEIDQEVLASLRTLAGTAETYDQAAVSGTATFVGDEHAALAVQSTEQLTTSHSEQDVALVTMQWLAPFALTILQSATTSAFARTTEGSFEAPTNTKMVGTLNNAMKFM
jgi:hypothetical protein